MNIKDLQHITFSAIIFDMDGTLYSSKKMKLCMAIDIALYHIFHPSEIYTVYILYRFRKEREHIHGTHKNLEQYQYKTIANKLAITEDKLKSVVDTWLMRRPLAYIFLCRYTTIPFLFSILKQKNIKIGIASEYPAYEKIKALNLFSDIVSCSLDYNVNAFKPDPKNFTSISEALQINPSNILVLGDRDDKDGICAKLSGMHFINISKSPENIFREIINSIVPSCKKDYFCVKIENT